MMKTLILLIISVSLSAMIYAQGNQLTGSVTYYNTQGTLIKDSAVACLYQGQTLVYQDTIHADGSFLFENMADGTYRLEVKCWKTWGGGNAFDGLKILKHFTQMPPMLTGLFLTVGDVNGSGGIPASADALAVVRRFVGLIPNFMPPNVPLPGSADWHSETFNLVIDANSQMVQNVHVLCTGDVNGSYIPW